MLRKYLLVFVALTASMISTGFAAERRSPRFEAYQMRLEARRTAALAARKGGVKSYRYRVPGETSLGAGTPQTGGSVPAGVPAATAAAANAGAAAGGGGGGLRSYRYGGSGSRGVARSYRYRGGLPSPSTSAAAATAGSLGRSSAEYSYRYDGFAEPYRAQPAARNLGRVIR